MIYFAKCFENAIARLIKTYSAKEALLQPSLLLQTLVDSEESASPVIIVVDFVVVIVVERSLRPNLGFLNSLDDLGSVIVAVDVVIGS